MAERDETGWARRRWTVLLGVVVALALLAVAGNFLPLPLVDAISATLTSAFVWVALLAALVTAAAVLLARQRRTKPRLVLAVLACLSLLGSLVVAGRLVAFGAGADVPVSVGQVLVGSHLDDAPDETVEFTQFEGEPIEMAVWRPRGDEASDAPVIVMTHGGGYITGTVMEGTPAAHARWFAERGYLVLGAEYTLATADRQTWDVAEGQIACALAWAGEHAADYGGDVDRLGMFGDSAGGNLVVNAAYKTASGELRSSCGGTVPAVDAVSGLYPAVDATAGWENTNLLGVVGRQMSTSYLGGSPEEFPERYESADAVSWITPDAPPTLVAYGERDHLVPPASTAAFIRAAADAGVATQEIVVPFAEHGFDLVNLGSIGSQVWREATLSWFAEHGAA